MSGSQPCLGTRTRLRSSWMWWRTAGCRHFVWGPLWPRVEGGPRVFHMAKDAGLRGWMGDRVMQMGYAANRGATRWLTTIIPRGWMRQYIPQSADTWAIFLKKSSGTCTHFD